MKTNHRRGFVRDKHLSAYEITHGKFDPEMPRKGGFKGDVKLPTGDGAGINHIGNDYCNGKHGAARSKRGAKKSLRNKIRKTEALHIEQSLEENDFTTTEEDNDC